jgi:hypothetical protein
MILGDFSLIDMSSFTKVLLTTLAGSSSVGGDAASLPALNLQRQFALVVENYIGRLGE